MDIKQIQLDPANVDTLPSLPAIYAIYAFDQADEQLCLRYESSCRNLRDAVAGHFKPTEPVVALRYFMLSGKKKILRYQLLNGQDVPVSFGLS